MFRLQGMPRIFIVSANLVQFAERQKVQVPDLRLECVCVSAIKYSNFIDLLRTLVSDPSRHTPHAII